LSPAGGFGRVVTKSHGRQPTRRAASPARPKKSSEVKGGKGTNRQLAEGRRHLVVVALDGRCAVLLELALALGVLSSDEVVQNRGRDDALVARPWLLALLKADSGFVEADGRQTARESECEALARRPGVTPKDDARLDRGIDLKRVDELLEDTDELGWVAGVADARRMPLPRGLEHLAPGVNQLDAVVGRRIVRGRDHDADRLAVQLLRPQDGEERDPEEGARQDVGPGRSGSIVRTAREACNSSKGSLPDVVPATEENHDRPGRSLATPLEGTNALCPEAGRAIGVVGRRLGVGLGRSLDDIDGERRASHWSSKLWDG
jgi:hypothetical protein